MAQPLPLQSQHGYDLIKNIQEWQSRQQDIPPAGDGDETLEHLEVSRLSANLLLLFKEIILSLRERVTIPKDARISLERSCSALILWSDGYGIAQGHLNDIFKRSSKLRYTLLKNLSRLGRALTERLIPLADISSEKLQQLCSSVESSLEKASSIINEELCQQSDDSSSDTGSAFSDDNIYEVAEDLKTDTYVLSSLDPIIKYPVFDLQKEDAIKEYIHSTWSPEKFFVDTIVKRFPLIDDSLASRLGRTIYERYLLRQTERNAILNEEGVTSTQQAAPEVAATIITKSKFHDSGVGTSIGPTVIHPETIMSHRHKNQSVRIPPLPKGAKAGMPFSCIVCSRTVVITNSSDWKCHIYLDLQPYMCLDISCSHSGTTFESREKWISHLALDHEMEPKWDSIECPFCKHVTGSGKLAVTTHFSEHLEEISLSALPIAVNSNESSENGFEQGDSDDDGENPHENSHPNAKDKGKSTAIADNGPINEKQNIPCNTLYVYNLPIDVSEEDLKVIFSKQQGYKRIVCRAAQIYPLYFIEFDDTSSAMKAVLDLHGKPQQNDKGRILLSFASDFLDQLGELGIEGDRSGSWPKPLPSEVPPLPPGWLVLYQENTHRNYYYNSETNVTRWEEPLFNPLYNPPPSMPPIQQGYIPLFDHSCQQWYYVNQETGQTQWQAPFVNPSYNHPSDQPPLPQGWTPLFDHGYQRWYYTNQETGRTQWELPGVNPAVFRDAAEQAAQRAKEQTALEAEGRAAVVSMKEEEKMAASIANKGKGYEVNATSTAQAALGMYSNLHVPPSTEEQFSAQVAVDLYHGHESTFKHKTPFSTDVTQQTSPLQPPPSNPKQNIGSEEWHKRRRDIDKDVERRRRETINEGINELAKLVPGCEENRGSILQRAVSFITQLKDNEQQNIEKWTLEKLLTEQTITELIASNDKLKQECDRLCRELETWKQVAQQAGIEPLAALKEEYNPAMQLSLEPEHESTPQG